MPNESSSIKETNWWWSLLLRNSLGDTIAQTRFESVSKHSNDSLLARGGVKKLKGKLGQDTISEEIIQVSLTAWVESLLMKKLGEDDPNRED
ncbi:hypothetical protein Tco_1335061 [Tanacetum coccineum]